MAHSMIPRGPRQESIESHWEMGLKHADTVGAFCDPGGFAAGGGVELPTVGETIAELPLDCAGAGVGVDTGVIGNAGVGIGAEVAASAAAVAGGTDPPWISFAAV